MITNEAPKDSLSQVLAAKKDLEPSKPKYNRDRRPHYSQLHPRVRVATWWWRWWWKCQWWWWCFWWWKIWCSKIFHLSLTQRFWKRNEREVDYATFQYQQDPSACIGGNCLDGKLWSSACLFGVIDWYPFSVYWSEGPIGWNNSRLGTSCTPNYLVMQYTWKNWCRIARKKLTSYFIHHHW